MLTMWKRNHYEVGRSGIAHCLYCAFPRGAGVMFRRAAEEPINTDDVPCTTCCVFFVLGISIAVIRALQSKREPESTGNVLLSILETDSLKATLNWCSCVPPSGLEDICSCQFCGKSCAD